MKRFLFLMIFISCTLFVFSEKLEIKAMNTSYITIGGKKLKVGNQFDSNAEISWSHNGQAMKVFSKKKKKYYLLTQKYFERKKISNFISYKKVAFTRRFPPITVEDHKEIFEEGFDLLDSVLIEVGWKVNDYSYFVIEYEKDGQKYSIILPTDNGSLVLNRNLFTESEDTDMELMVSVKYIEEEYNKCTLITDKMFIDIVPLWIE